MKLNEFSIVDGSFVTEIFGQQRFGYGHSGYADIADAKEIFDHEGYYKGMVLRFYEYGTGEVYEPFVLKRNISYSDVLYHDGLFYFLQADFIENVVRLIAYYPNQFTKVITTLNMGDIELKRLILIGGNQVNVVHHGDTFISYYPNQFELNLGDDDTVVMIDEDKVYINRWIEEENELEDGSIDYNWHHKLLIKHLNGELLSEEIARLQQNKDGSWWIS
ncbi:hypothetical protein [Macrococcus animalis]|uniref:hypothetical protein n=1 Tax=Macrococcus animalis TaxID=3395467 RepID=UPI0039BEC912